MNKTIIRNKVTGATLTFEHGAATNWETGLNIQKHVYLNQTDWKPEPFEDSTRLGLLHVIERFLKYIGHSPKMIDRSENETSKADIECIVKGLRLSIIVLEIPVNEREYVYEYDINEMIQPDGRVEIIFSSAQSFFIFYEDSFGQNESEE